MKVRGGEVRGGSWEELGRVVERMDAHLDEEVGFPYRLAPLAQDWARIVKVVEEAGEAVEALMGLTGQNPRKGHYGVEMDLWSELADVTMTGLYALQHFTKDRELTMELLLKRAQYHEERVFGDGDDDA